MRKKTLFHVVRLTMCGFCGIWNIQTSSWLLSVHLILIHGNISTRRKKYSLNIEFYFTPFFSRILRVHTQKIQIYRTWKKNCSWFCGVKRIGWWTVWVNLSFKFLLNIDFELFVEFLYSSEILFSIHFNETCKGNF